MTRHLLRVFFGMSVRTHLLPRSGTEIPNRGSLFIASQPAAFTRLARRVIGQPFYGWFRRAQFSVGRFNALDWSTIEGHLSGL